MQQKKLKKRSAPSAPIIKPEPRVITADLISSKRGNVIFRQRESLSDATCRLFLFIPRCDTPRNLVPDKFPDERLILWIYPDKFESYSGFAVRSFSCPATVEDHGFDRNNPGVYFDLE